MGAFGNIRCVACGKSIIEQGSISEIVERNDWKHEGKYFKCPECVKGKTGNDRKGQKKYFSDDREQ